MNTTTTNRTEQYGVRVTFDQGYAMYLQQAARGEPYILEGSRRTPFKTFAQARRAGSKCAVIKNSELKIAHIQIVKVVTAETYFRIK